MASIFTRKAINAILSDESLTADERTEKVFTLYGQALDDGYLSKSAAQAAQNAAVEAARAEALKDVHAPNVKDSDEYKALQGQYDADKAMWAARSSEDFADVKPKFFEQVYRMIDHAEGAKPVKDQLSEIAGKYEEYFTGSRQEAQPAKPSFGAPTQGSAPSGRTGPSFMDTWGFVPKK